MGPLWLAPSPDPAEGEDGETGSPLCQTMGVNTGFLPLKEHWGVFRSGQPLWSPELNRWP